MKQLLIIALALTITAPARADIKDDRIAELERENRLLKADVYRAKQALVILRRRLPGAKVVKTATKKTPASDFPRFEDLIDTLRDSMPSKPTIFSSYTSIAQGKMREYLIASAGKTITLTVRVLQNPPLRTSYNRTTKISTKGYSFPFVSQESQVRSGFSDGMTVTKRLGVHWGIDGLGAMFAESYRDRLATLKHGDVIKIKGVIEGGLYFRPNTCTLSDKPGAILNSITLSLKDCELITPTPNQRN